MDYMFHNSRHSAPWGILEDYYWETFGVDSEFETDQVKIMISDFGSFANYHPHHVNIEHGPLQYHDDLRDANRRTSPGSGAFSYYDVDFYAMADIGPGQEMFVNYGSTWGDDREYDISKPQDYEDAKFVVDYLMRGCGLLGPIHGGSECVDRSLQRLQRIFDNSAATKSAKVTFHILLRAITNYRIRLAENSALYNLIIRMVKRVLYAIDPAVAKLLPNTRHELVYMYKHGITSLSLFNRVQTLDWLEENGVCLDHIERKESEIMWAGHGAFATRNLTQGSIVAPMPFLHIFDRDNVNMYSDTIGRNGEVTPDMNEFVMEQLNLNYCFGHSELSILLCSYSTAQLVNHKSANACFGDEGQTVCRNGPNVGYRWASPLWDETNSGWMNQSISEIQEQMSRGLSFELYALRDITAGEEITFDYGDEWDEAWREHVLKWASTPRNGENYESFRSVVEMNNDSANYQQIRTKMERANNPYPENISTACFYWDEEPSEARKDALMSRVLDFASAKSIWNYAVDGKKFYPGSPENKSFDDQYWPCEVYYRDINRNGEDIYTVRIFADTDVSDPPWWQIENVPVFVKFLPRNSIRFVNLPNESDQFLLNAFRHPIGIRDGLLPDHWIDGSDVGDAG